MQIAPHARRWLFNFGLAAPVVFLPQVGDRMNSSDLAFGFPGFLDIHLQGSIGSAQLLPHSWLAFPVAVIWTIVFGVAWQVRLWAKSHNAWVGAFVQALLTSLYCALTFFFLWNLVCLVWFLWCYSLNTSEFTHALILARAWLPYLYALGATGVLTTVFLDSRMRQGPQRVVHCVFAVLLIVAFARLTPVVVWQLSEFDQMISWSAAQNK